ncbi:MAG TPA: helix-turn-helix domain-containing protein [Bacillota bacterium]|nr:helix-turn-helix domain-containing protein [Bacillota bacterium]
MKELLIPIGQMARINNVTVPTLRHYDKLGILKPRYTDPETGYRYYDILQNARLDMIAYMKELGMSLAEIAAVLLTKNLALIEEILAQKNEQIHQNMRELKAQHDAVNRAINAIERYRKSPVTGTLSLEYIDRRYILAVPCSENFYQKSIISYERVLYDLRKSLIQHSVSKIHSYNVGTSISRRDFERQSFIADKVFIFADSNLAKQLKDVDTLESGMYACVYSDRFEDETAFATKLLHFCKENHYQISGDYICEILTEFNVFESGSRNMFLRLHVPVSFEKSSFDSHAE